jgi:hypothetical protein
MPKSWEEVTVSNANKAGFECRAVEWVQAEIPAEELELKWSELIKKLLEIDDKFRNDSSEKIQELAA